MKSSEQKKRPQGSKGIKQPCHMPTPFKDDASNTIRRQGKGISKTPFSHVGLTNSTLSCRELQSAAQHWTHNSPYLHVALSCHPDTKSSSGPGISHCAKGLCVCLPADLFHCFFSPSRFFV